MATSSKRQVPCVWASPVRFPPTTKNAGFPLMLREEEVAKTEPSTLASSTWEPAEGEVSIFISIRYQRLFASDKLADPTCPSSSYSRKLPVLSTVTHARFVEPSLFSSMMTAFSAEGRVAILMYALKKKGSVLVASVSNCTRAALFVSEPEVRLFIRKEREPVLAVEL